VKNCKLKTEFIKMRVTTSFKEKLQSMAKKNRLSVSGYIRKLVVEDNEKKK
jgi:hypothetical protein